MHIGLFGHKGYIGSNFLKELSSQLHTVSIDSTDVDVVILCTGHRACDLYKDRNYLDHVKSICAECKKNNKPVVIISSYAALFKTKESYAKLKIMMEECCRQSGVDYLILYYPVVYSKYMPKNMLMYRMTHDKSFEFKDFGEHYYFINIYSAIKYSLSELSNLYTQQSWKKSVVVPADRMYLNDVYKLCKLNYFNIAEIPFGCKSANS